MFFKGYNLLNYFKRDGKIKPDINFRVVCCDIALGQNEDSSMVVFANGSTISFDKYNNLTSKRGDKSKWYPFIDENGNGCVTNVLTGETFVDWTKEELEEE